jgi:hypothetical protein
MRMMLKRCRSGSWRVGRLGADSMKKKRFGRDEGIQPSELTNSVEAAPGRNDDRPALGTTSPEPS